MALTNNNFSANLLGMAAKNSPEVKAFLRSIGSKGGKKSAQHPNRHHLNQQAAIARWRKRIPEPKAIPK